MLVYFGVLLFLYNQGNVLLPTSFFELLAYQPTRYYYPNINAIASDIVGNPTMVLLLVVLRSYIPRQLNRLHEDGLLEELTLSRLRTRIFHFLALNTYIRRVAFVFVPMAIALAFCAADIIALQPPDLPGRYAIFLTTINNYTKAAIVVQWLFAFVILQNFKLTPKLNPAHPDQCSGLAPFGNLALAAYGYLFFWALFQSLGSLAGFGAYVGGGGIERFFMQASGPLGLIYIWLLFPMAVLVIFGTLVYQPHQEMQALKVGYLLRSSQDWATQRNVPAELDTREERLGSLGWHLSW